MKNINLLAIISLSLVLVFSSCKKEENTSRNNRLIKGNWSLEKIDYVYDDFSGFRTTETTYFGDAYGTWCNFIFDETTVNVWDDGDDYGTEPYFINKDVIQFGDGIMFETCTIKEIKKDRLIVVISYPFDNEMETYTFNK